MHLFHNRTILSLELKFFMYWDTKKNTIAKEKQNLNVLSSSQIDLLSFYCPIQLIKWTGSKKIILLLTFSKKNLFFLNWISDRFLNNAGKSVPTTREKPPHHGNIL